MFFLRTKHWAVLATVVGAIYAVPAALRAAPAFSQSFNGPTTAWQLLESGVPARILAHDCIPGGARDGEGIERIAVAATAGQSVLFNCPTPPIAVLDELQVHLWVQSSRPDIQLAARIALPRSVDRDRHAVTAIVKGAVYNRAGRWQELVLSQLPKRLEAQVRILRTMQPGPIDSHEAYLESVVLIVPGDPNGVELGTDQLEVEGVQIDPTNTANLTSSKVTTKNVSLSNDAERMHLPMLNSPAAVANSAGAAGDATSPARLQGSLLLVEDKPFFPRTIQWNGEPLEFLAKLGFNVVCLTSPPIAEQITDAKRQGLWFVCVPPRPDAIVRDGLGAAGDRVLAWSLEDEAIAADPNYALRWADAIRERDVVYGRPILISPDSSWGLASRSGDILLARHARVSCMSAKEYETWLAGRSRFGRPGTPVWASIPSQFGDAVRLQRNALTHATTPAPAVDVEQLETLLHIACLNGVRGICIQSSSSLSETDPATRSRATELELVNRRLALIEPWLAGGNIVGQSRSADNQYEGTVMYVDRARLLIPFATAVTQEMEALPRRPLTKEISFLVPGVSESSQAYFVTPISMSSLSPQRVAGGTRLIVPSATDAFVVITEDPQVVRSLRQRITQQATQTARLKRDFLVSRAQLIFGIDRRLAQLGLKANLNAADATTMNAQLGQIDALLNSGQLEDAHNLMGNVQTDERHLIVEQQTDAGMATGLQSNAFGLTYDRLADFAALQRSFESLRGGENVLPGGDFENLNEMTKLGWQHVVHPTLGDATHAELSTYEPEHGTYCLELQATAPPNSPLPDIAQPRVWIVSPAMSLEAGSTVEISGWVRVDKSFGIPGEGLEIIDSLGGPELSTVVSDTSGWQLFRMVRAVPENADLRLTFAVTGVGSAMIDAVMVRTLQQPVARRLPTVAPSAR